MTRYLSYFGELLKCVLIALVISFFLTTFIVEARQVPTGSMIPTIAIGDKVIVDKLFYKLAELNRGDIIVFRPPPAARSDLDYIKRIIGLPGDEIEVKNRTVYVNGQALKEGYIKEAPTYNFDLFKVPPKTLFVMGDNRNNSLDSHLWGVVPQENIKGKALVRFWPFSKLSSVK